MFDAIIVSRLVWACATLAWREAVLSAVENCRLQMILDKAKRRYSVICNVINIIDLFENITKYCLNPTNFSTRA